MIPFQDGAWSHLASVQIQGKAPEKHPTPS